MGEILAIGAHPDDCEIFMGGTLLFLRDRSFGVSLCSLTMGEAGTYGNRDIRIAEMAKAAALLGIKERIPFNMGDGKLENSEDNRLQVIEVIRKLRPEIVFSFAPGDHRHPDHTQCGKIVRESCFLSGLEKIETDSEPFRPSAFIGFPELVITKKPDFIFDITEYRERKIELIRCYGTQVTAENESGKGSKTLIRSDDFWRILNSRDVQAGAAAGIKYGEPFYSEAPPKISDPVKAFFKELK